MPELVITREELAHSLQLSGDTPVLTVRQPWADAIVNGWKDIENRTWSTKYRGALMIHASKWTPSDSAYEHVAKCAGKFGANSIPRAELFGGIIGRVELVDVVTESASPWFSGPFGWLLANQKKVPFAPCVGRLGLWPLARAFK